MGPHSSSSINMNQQHIATTRCLQEAQTELTSRLETLLRRKGCSSGSLVSEDLHHNSLTSSQTASHSPANKHIIKPAQCRYHQKQHPKSTSTRYLNHLIISPLKSALCPSSSVLISLQIVLLVLTLAASAEPNPANSIVGQTGTSHSGGSGGVRAATTKALRGPPMNGSIFGKRSLNNKRIIRPTTTTTATTSDRYAYEVAADSNAIEQQANNKQKSLEEYEDVITDIIEDFLAKNSDAEPEEASRAFCRMIVYECSQYLARSRPRRVTSKQQLNAIGSLPSRRLPATRLSMAPINTK